MELVLQTREKNVKDQTLTPEIPAGNILKREYLRMNE